METDSVKTLSELLSKFSKEEFISAINEINGKIGSMYTISTEDFTRFSSQLKDYHTGIKSISDEVNELQNYVDTEVKKLEKLQSAICVSRRERLLNIVEISHSIADVFMLVQILVSRVIMPFNNLRQSVVSMQYLLASLRLNLSCNPLNNNAEIFKTIDEFEKFITQYRQQIATTDTYVKTLSDFIWGMKNNEQVSYMISNLPIDSYVAPICRELKDFNIRELFNTDLFSSMNKNVQSCFTNLNKVVTNIQYHDIIRQKIEHIKEVQNAVVERLDDIDDGQVEKQIIDSKLKFLIKLPKVIDMQVAQLMYVNNDYQVSIENITSVLLDVGSELKQLISKFDKISETSHRVVGVVLPELTARQEQYENIVKSNENCINAVFDEFNKLTLQYQEAKIHFADVFKNAKEVRERIEQLEKQLEKNDNCSNTDIGVRLKCARADIKCNANLMKVCLNKITEEIRGLDIFKNQLTSKKSVDLQTETIAKIQQKVVGIGTKASNNSIKCRELSNVITNSLNNVEYYSYFRKCVDEIVELENNLNIKSNLSSVKLDIQADDSELLDYINSIYTMKSERDVYNNIFNNKAISQSDDDDIEFF